MNFILFDMDGVVVETEHLKAAAHVAAIEHYGGTVPPELYPVVMGQPHASVRAAFIAVSGVLIEPADYTRLYREAYHRMVAEGPLLVPGIQELILRLHAAGFRIGLVTSSSMGSAIMVLDWLFQKGYFERDLFAARVYSEDVPRGKPAPDPYLLGLERLGVKECRKNGCRGLAFEDSNAGIESAVAAGLPVIARRHQFNAHQDFSRASAILDSFEDTERVIQLVQSSLRTLNQDTRSHDHDEDFSR